jgi:hypothetical protein
LKGKPPSEHEPEASYQPPPLVMKRRMKRSCSEWEVLVLNLSMEASEGEVGPLVHLPNCMNRRGERSMKFALRILDGPHLLILDARPDLHPAIVSRTVVIFSFRELEFG